MDNASYVNLTRQSGLLKELGAIANNIANASTVGFKREGAVFSEYIAATQSTNTPNDPKESLSMGRLSAHASNMLPGSMRSTGGDFDVAIEGDGFFLIDVNGQTELTRAGHFMVSSDGLLINTEGNPVLDDAEGQIQIPAEASRINIGFDGVLSADGVEIGRLGVVTADPNRLARAGNNNWIATEGFQALEDTKVLQGFLEDSNVQPVVEMARMIEVQRFYDAGQKLLEMEDDRIKQVITTIRQTT